MNARKERLLGDDIPCAGDRVRPAGGAIGAMIKSLDQLIGPQIIRESDLILWLMERSSRKSIAPKILAFAIGGSSDCSGGRSCARLYLAQQGYSVPLRDTTTGMDLTRRAWWLRAMFERVTDQWGGDEQGVRKIAAAQPLIWEQAQAATDAWENTQRKQDARFAPKRRDL